MYTVFGLSESGNCYKVKLFLHQLGVDYDWTELDIFQGETRTPEYLRLNPNGKVPLLKIDSEQYLAESNAILCYLADGTCYWATDAVQKAQTLQWMFFEQYSHEPYIAVARFIRKFLPPDHPRQTEIPRLLEGGYQALQVMEQHLSEALFFVDDRYSIADISLYAYTHIAPDGGFDLASFPGIQAWMERVRSQRGFSPMS